MNKNKNKKNITRYKDDREREIFTIFDRFLAWLVGIDPSSGSVHGRATKTAQIRISRARVNTVSPTLGENRFDASPFQRFDTADYVFHPAPSSCTV